MQTGGTIGDSVTIQQVLKCYGDKESLFVNARVSLLAHLTIQTTQGRLP